MSTHNIYFCGDIDQNSLISLCSRATLQPLYNTVHYNTVLDMTQKCIMYIMYKNV